MAMYQVTGTTLTNSPLAAGVETDEHDNIIKASPILQRFLNQPLYKLMGWARVQGWKVEEVMVSPVDGHVYSKKELGL